MSENEVFPNQAVAAVPENHIRVEDKLYSTEKLANLHPGGPLFIKVKLQVHFIFVVGNMNARWL